jgi:putative ABC transport system substrate-binding protein
MTGAAVHLLVLLLGFICAAGQAPAQMRRIGILVPEMGRAQSQAQKGLLDGLRQLGYQQRKHIAIEIRNARGDRNALQPAADDLAASKIDVIFATGTRATMAARAATRSIPIVFVHPGDPIALGLMAPSTNVAANVTGVAAFAAQTTETRLALLKEIVPAVQRIHIYFDSNDAYSRENLSVASTAVKKLTLQVIHHGVKSVEELKASISATPAEPDAAIFHIPDDLVEGEVDFLFETARKKKLPTMFNEEEWAIAGALAAYGPSYLQMGRQAAGLIDMIFKNRLADPAPVERAAKFDLTLNYRTANIIGLRLPAEILKKADKVIR